MKFNLIINNLNQPYQYGQDITIDKLYTYTYMHLRIPARRSSLGSGYSTPEMDVTLSKKSNSLLNMSRAFELKPSIIRSLTIGSSARKEAF